MTGESKTVRQIGLSSLALYTEVRATKYANSCNKIRTCFCFLWKWWLKATLDFPQLFNLQWKTLSERKILFNREDLKWRLIVNNVIHRCGSLQFTQESHFSTPEATRMDLAVSTLEFIHLANKSSLSIHVQKSPPEGFFYIGLLYSIEGGKIIHLCGTYVSLRDGPRRI